LLNVRGALVGVGSSATEEAPWSPQGRVERRIAAILAPDVAGWSRLIGADEEGTLGGLKALRPEVIDPKIAGYHGRIVKTSGDGLLVEFASVVDALRCAAEVQAAMAKGNAHVAVGPSHRVPYRHNVGDIVVEDGDTFGDGVNVAFRLEGPAEPGGICVSARLQEDAAGRIELKNLTRPVRVYRVREAAAENPSAPAQPALPLPDKPSIAVLHFANMSGDQEQNTSPTVWWRRSSRRCRGSAGCASSPALRASRIKAKRLTSSD
jgi:adenylate cyclase